jgi:hypothetical protein
MPTLGWGYICVCYLGGNYENRHGRDIKGKNETEKIEGKFFKKC